MTDENQFYKILYESRLIFHKHTKQTVIFSVFNLNLYRIVFYGSWISGHYQFYYAYVLAWLNNGRHFGFSAIVSEVIYLYNVITLKVLFTK
jgi:hypothetical protein